MMAESLIAGTRAVPGAALASRLGWLRRVPWIALLIIMTLAIVAVFAPLLSSQSPTEVFLPNTLKPPAWYPGGSIEFPLGTDSMGRDLLTQIFYGARTAFMIAGVGLLVGASLGTAIGIMAGYIGGRTDALLMRTVDVGLSFPIILFALLLAISLGPGFHSVILAIGLVLWSRFARPIRGEVLSVKEKDFIAYARASGASHLRVMLVHILPNVLNTVVVLTTLNVGWVILTEASLSFLGAGIPPSTPSWGQMVAQGRDFIATKPWLSIAPGIPIFLMVMSFNLLGDWLRDTLDPKLRQV